MESNMQQKELNCATVTVVKRMKIRGRVTAEEMDRGLRTGKKRSFWRTASLTFLGTLTVAGFFVPLSARADHDEDSRHGREDNDKGIRAEIAALKAQVATLQSSVSTLQDQVKTLKTANVSQKNEINSLQTSNTTLQKQLTAVQSNHALLLGPFVSVDPNPEIGVIGPNIIFSGANIHIVSGLGATNDNGNPSGLGNLIIGYNEDPQNTGNPPLQPGDRGGSHNLVIGRGNRFTKAAFGGLVAGEANTISNEAASVSGGSNSTASGQWASVSGGLANTASGNGASVSGGFYNTARGFAGSTVLGGLRNTAGADYTVVLGGTDVTDNNPNSSAPQPPFP